MDAPLLTIEKMVDISKLFEGDSPENEAAQALKFVNLAKTYGNVSTAITTGYPARTWMDWNEARMEALYG